MSEKNYADLMELSTIERIMYYTGSICAGLMQVKRESREKVVDMVVKTIKTSTEEVFEDFQDYSAYFEEKVKTIVKEYENG